MAATPIYAFPYPGTGDSPNGPAQIQALAEALEAKLVLVDAAISGKADPALFIRKTTQEQVVNSIALQDDDHFAFTVAANAVYKLNGYIAYTGALDGGASAGGLKMQFTGPAGATLRWTNYGTNPGGGVVEYNVVSEALAAASPRSVPTNGGGLGMTCAPRGTLITAGTSGTFRLRWAQNIANATPTTILADSWLELQRVA